MTQMAFILYTLSLVLTVQNGVFMVLEQLVISDECIGCGMCVKVCIRGHLAVDGSKKAREVESPYSCFRCGHCSAVCPKGAITLRGTGPEEVEPVDGVPFGPEKLMDLYRSRRSQRWFDRPCTKEEIEDLIGSTRFAPTAENSQTVEFAVIDERFEDFMKESADILRSHTDEHPRIGQFVEYVDGGMKGRNNPFTWEGRQIIIAFARFPIDAIIAMEQLDLMACTMGLGGFHSRWLLQASENDPDRFMAFFPEIDKGLNAYAVYVIGRPRIRYRRTVPRDDHRVFWYRFAIIPIVIQHDLNSNSDSFGR